jgi:outer membrane beta-barrel protein
MDCTFPARVLAVALVAVALFSAAPASAEEQVYAIQNRIFDRHHEVDLLLGFIPNDSFHDPLGLGVQYTFNFNEVLAWEVVRAQYFLNKEKDLKKDLEENFGVTPIELDWLQYGVFSSLVLKPSYGKDALWNRKVINHETFVAAGAGVVRYESETSQGETGGETAFSLVFGLGRKYFINEKFCLNLELRDFVNFRESGAENRVYLGLSLGFRFDLARRRQRTDDSAQRLRDFAGGGNGDD